MTLAADTAIAKSYNDEGECLDVCIQDQHTEPIAAYFSKAISNFTISVDTVVSTATDLVYTFTATAGHGIVNGNEVILLDTAIGRSLSFKVLNVATNVITVDRPIDAVYHATTTLGRIITTQMAVNGSVTPQIFSIRAGSTPADIVSMGITILDNTDMDDGKFGGITALTRGLVLRIINSYQRTIFCFKTNEEIKQFATRLEYSTKAPAGSYGLLAGIAGREAYGVVLRIADNDVIQWVVQDDLTGLSSLKISALGHYTQGEI